MSIQDTASSNRASRVGRGAPRRRHRGIAALFGIVLLTAVVSSAVLAWQIGEARMQRAADANAVTRAAAIFGYGLHHWLHEARQADTFSGPGAASARALTQAEDTARIGHAATASWHAFHRDWTVTALIARPDGDDDNALVHGIVLLQPASSVDQALRDAVATRLAATSGAELDVLTLARTASGLTINENRDLAVPAWIFSRIDPTVVLRAPRVGVSSGPMATALDLGDNDILEAGEFEADRLDATRLVPADTSQPFVLNGGLALSNGDAVTTAILTASGRMAFGSGLSVGSGGLEAGDSLSVTGTGASAKVAGTITIAGGLSVNQTTAGDAALMACAANEFGVCTGGDFDLTAGTGTPNWSRVDTYGEGQFTDLAATCTPFRSTDYCLNSRFGFIDSIPTIDDREPELIYHNLYLVEGDE